MNKRLYKVFRVDNFTGKPVEVDVLAEEGVVPSSGKECEDVIEKWVADSANNADLEPVLLSDYFWSEC